MSHHHCHQQHPSQPAHSCQEHCITNPFECAVLPLDRVTTAVIRTGVKCQLVLSSSEPGVNVNYMPSLLSGHHTADRRHLSFHTKRLARKEGICHIVALRKPALRKKNIKDQSTWAEEYANQDWCKVIYTDECSMVIGSQNNCVQGSMHKGKQQKAKTLLITSTMARESIMVWAGIAYNFKTLLVLIELKPSFIGDSEQISAASLRSEEYAEMILQGPLYTATQLLPGFKVLEDGAPCHTAHLCKQIQAELGIDSIRHPGNLPDLNYIENIWSLLKNHISSCCRLPTNREEFFKLAQEVWDNKISLDAINACIDSMPKQ